MSTPSTLLADIPVGQLVAEQPARAATLEAFGVDYCCGGKLSLRWFARKRGFDLDAAVRALEALPRATAGAGEPHWPTAPLADLVAHLVATHHAFLREAFPRLDALAAEAIRDHGADRPDLAHLTAVLERFWDTTMPHLDHEERVIFPLVVRIERGLADRDLARRFLETELAKLEAEHVRAGAELDELRRVAAETPARANEEPTLHALMAGLEGLAADTYRHVHKENSILFPRALALVHPGDATTR